MTRTLTSAATLGAVNATGAPGPPTDGGGLLFSRVLPDSAAALPARLYALAMSVGPLGPRQAGPVALAGIRFDAAAPPPEVAPTDVAVTLLATGERVAVREENITRAGTDGRAFVLTVRLPDDYRGMVRKFRLQSLRPLIAAVRDRVYAACVSLPCGPHCALSRGQEHVCSPYCCGHEQERCRCKCSQRMRRSRCASFV